MDDEKRVAAASFREYIDNARQTSKVFRWMWTEVTTPLSRRKLYWMFVGLAFIITMQAFQPGAISFVFTGLAQHDRHLVTTGLVTFFCCIILQKIGDKFQESAREWVLGLNWVRLDDRITELFFEKSVGQHIHEGTTLSVSNIDKGRWKLLDLQGLFLFEAIPVIAQLLISVTLVWILSWMAGLIMTTMVAIYIGWSLYLNLKVNQVCTPIDKDSRALNRRRVERWERIERVKVSGQEEYELQDMSKIFGDIMTRDRNFWLWFISRANVRGMLNAVGLTTVMCYGTYLVWTGKWQIGFLYPLFVWSTRVSENIWKLGAIEHQINWNMPAVKSMIEALSIPPTIVDRADATMLDHTTAHRIEFVSMSHTYPAETKKTEDMPPALTKVNFMIREGEKVALLGSSGSGKTTVMRKLLRFDDPSSGSILIDGVDLRNIVQKSWRRGIGYIPQQSQVFDGTIRYNLTYGLSHEERAAIADDDLWTLMKLLKIDFGERLTEGLNTIVGKNGIKLSGGQAQRLMIGAAVMRRPWLLVVDEATSSLDSTTEKQVQEGLQQVLAGNATSALIVAHRLSTVRHLCNTFVVLKAANEVQNGDSQVEAVASSFEELYRISPTFKRLADDQGIKI